jgi:hypothetical protein
VSRAHWRLRVGVLCLGGALLSACARSDKPAPSTAERIAHKKGIAAAAMDRMLLQGFVKQADSVNRRLGSLRRVSKGFMRGDTSVIWFAYFAGDTLLVLDETRREPRGTEENARYLYRDTTLRYMVYDRKAGATGAALLRARYAFGFDSLGTLAASSKNVNDAAIPLDTAADVLLLVRQARELRALVLSSAKR